MMTWYNLLALIGVPAIFASFWANLYARSRKNETETKATKKGIQALLRAQMISEYHKAKDKGFAPIYAKDNFENMWQNYHALGLNGVMDGIREEYMQLPTERGDSK